jgi:hypothetical protein
MERTKKAAIALGALIAAAGCGASTNVGPRPDVSAPAKPALPANPTVAASDAVTGEPVAASDAVTGEPHEAEGSEAVAEVAAPAGGESVIVTDAHGQEISLPAARHLFQGGRMPGESHQSYMFRCCTPIALVFDPARGIELRADDGLTSFDLSPAQDGAGTRTDWPTAATPWLAFDRDGNGAIDSGRELFGAATLLEDGSTADHGFVALGELDTDGDGVLDPGDPAFAELLAWADDDGDRRSDPSELTPIAALGVTAIDLRFDPSPICDDRGNCEIERSVMSWRTAGGAMRTGAAIDLHLAPR